MENREHPYAKHVEKAARKLVGHPTAPHAEQYMTMWGMHNERTLLEQSRGGVCDQWSRNGNHLRTAATAEVSAQLGLHEPIGETLERCKRIAEKDQAAYFRMVGAAQIMLDEFRRKGTTTQRGQWLAVRFHLTLLDYFGRGYNPDNFMDDYVNEFGPSIDEYDLKLMKIADGVHLPIIEGIFETEQMLALSLWGVEDWTYSDPEDPETEQWHKDNTAETIAMLEKIVCPGYVLRSGKQMEAYRGATYPAQWYVLSGNPEPGVDIMAHGDSVVEALENAKMW
jgi:hypothetical protein